MMRNLAIAAVMAFLASGCGQEAAPMAETPEGPAYAAPPVARQVSADAAGAITVTGLAGPDERVRLIQMDGTAHGVTADGSGAFSIILPGAGRTDRLFNLSVERAGQSVSSDGWLFSPATAPTRAVMLRPGAASLAVGPAPLLAVVDLDTGGGMAVSGLTEAGATVEVQIDGQPGESVSAGADGRWFLVLEDAVQPGPHQLVVSAGERRANRTMDLQSVRPTGALETSAEDGAVRIVWALPGGGSQTTWILLP